MNHLFLILGGFSGAISVALGAFGAHALKSRIPPDRLETFETGVRYQMFHAFALLATAFAAGQTGASGLIQAAGWAFIAGTLLFSGSLYLLVSSGKRLWGAVTPFGGVAFITGWLCLALAFWIG